MPVLRIDNKIITTVLIDIVKNLKTKLYNGKLASIKVMGDNIRLSCPNPNHKGGHESIASADIYIGDKTNKLEYGWFKCFTCGSNCPFYHFVAMCFECSDEKAKQWLIDNYADDTVEFDIDLPEIIINKNTQKNYLDESILESFESYHPYMTKRKLSKRIIEVFQIKYDSKTKSIVFPVYDENNKLVMLTKRSVETKRFVIPPAVEKPLYLLNYIIKNNIDKAVITEGQIDALTSCVYGMPAIATMGAISQHQIAILNKSPIRVLYMMFDNDDAGKRFTNTVMRAIRKDIMVFNVDISKTGKKDINDLTEDEFWFCIKKAENQI